MWVLREPAQIRPAVNLAEDGGYLDKVWRICGVGGKESGKEENKYHPHLHLEDSRRLALRVVQRLGMVDGRAAEAILDAALDAFRVGLKERLRKRGTREPTPHLASDRQL